jgi:hypothetical protein
MLAPLTLMTFQSSQVYIHYVLCLVPVPFVLIARGVDWLATDLPRYVTRAIASRAAIFAVAILVGSVLLTQALAVGAFYTALNRIASLPPASVTATAWQEALNRSDLTARQLGIGELHGLPLRYWQEVADQARRSASAADVREVTVVSGILDDANRHLDRRRKALNYLLGPDLAVRFPLEGLIVVPTTRTALFLTLPDQELPRIVQRASTRLADVPQPGTSSATGIFQVRSRPADEVITLRRRTNVDVGHGVRLVVLDHPPDARPGQTVSLAAYLLVEDASKLGANPVEPAVELLDPATGLRTSNRRSGLPSAEWQSGDLLIQQLNLTVPVGLPEGDYALQFDLVSPSTADDAPLGDIGTVRAATLRVRR